MAYTEYVPSTCGMFSVCPSSPMVCTAWHSSPLENIHDYRVRNRRFISRSSRSRPYLQHRVLHLPVPDILDVIHERFFTRRQPQHRQSRRKQ
ncbi:MAG: hypothetical protein K6D59_03080 [Bacteroidales bacterium]|nr:hypothetical protein [Bacteroidales bacterium]